MYTVTIKLNEEILKRNYEVDQVYKEIDNLFFKYNSSLKVLKDGTRIYQNQEYSSVWIVNLALKDTKAIQESVQKWEYLDPEEDVLEDIIDGYYGIQLKHDLV